MPRDSSSSATILVVEDEYLVRGCLVDALEKRGWSIVEASTGEEAVACLEAGEATPDLVLTDIRLGGGLDGWDVAEKFREADPSIGIIYTSGNVITPTREVENSQFFPKPYNVDDIVIACERKLVA